MMLKTTTTIETIMFVSSITTMILPYVRTDVFADSDDQNICLDINTVTEDKHKF